MKFFVGMIFFFWQVFAENIDVYFNGEEDSCSKSVTQGIVVFTITIIVDVFEMLIALHKYDDKLTPSMKFFVNSLMEIEFTSWEWITVFGWNVY